MTITSECSRRFDLSLIFHKVCAIYLSNFILVKNKISEVCTLHRLSFIKLELHDFQLESVRIINYCFLTKKFENKFNLFGKSYLYYCRCFIPLFL
jgi:hypothetical protein